MFRASETQGTLFGGYNRLIDWVGKETFYAYLGENGRRIFDDELFREWYCADNGRPCVCPSTLALTTILQMYDRCSDQEAVDRTKFDDRWKVALNLEEGDKPFAKSTLQEFRAKLLLHDAAEALFLRLSLGEAKRFDLLNGSKLKTVLDTSPLLGRGAVQDTYNLVAEGIKILCRALSGVTGDKLEVLAKRLDLSRYVDRKVSLKGGAGIDWSNDSERRVFLNSIVADAERLLSHSAKLKAVATEKQQALMTQAEELLQRLISQDTEPDPSQPGKVRIRQGTAKDRMPSATDPEIRHGRKSASKRFDGHKLATATDPSSGMITAVDVLPGNAPDSQNALKMTEAVEANTGLIVEKTVGDCAYGPGETRQEYVEAGRTLVAKVPAPPSNQPFHKTHFQVSDESVTCPVGQTTEDFKWVKSDQGPRVKQFYFPVPVCQACPHRDACLRTKDKSGGRTVTLHPQEDLLQAAREFQQTEEFRQDLRDRQQAEHGIARMMQLGARQARYVGRAKTKVQAVVTATVLNLLILFSLSLKASAISPVSSSDHEVPQLPQTQRQADDDRDPSQETAAATSGVWAHRHPDGVRGGPVSEASSSRGDPRIW